MMKRLFTTIMVVVSAPVMFYGQDLPFMDGSSSSQQKADRYYGQMAYTDALEHYARALTKSPGNADVKLKMADCYTQLRDFRSALSCYQGAMTSKQVTSRDMLQYADVLTAAGDYEQARKWYEAYHDNTPGETVSLQRIARLKNIESLYEDSLAYDVKLTDFNSPQSDFSPVYWNNQILFVSNRPSKGLFRATDGRSGHGFLDIYTYGNGQVSRFDGLSKALHEGPVSLFEKGSKLIVTVNQPESTGKNDHGITSGLKLRIYAQVNGEWHDEGDFPHNTAGYAVAHPAFDQARNVLYFVSNKPGGKGGADVYASAYQGGVFLEPKNMESINTPGDELFPFVSNDGTLYFASNGRGGLGGLDLFKTNISDAKGTVYNLGYPVNTPDDDFGLAIDATGRKGYVSSNRKPGAGDDDIYALTIFRIRVEARFNDRLTGQPVKPGKITIVDKASGEVAPYQVDGDRVIFDALKGREYDLVMESDGYGKQSIAVSARTDQDLVALNVPVVPAATAAGERPTPIAIVRFANLSKEVVYQIMPGEMLVPVDEGQLTRSDTAQVVGSPYFKFDSDDILSGQAELKKIADLLRKFQTITVQVVVYCDGFGTLEYNDTLAQKRLGRIVDDLVQMGITRTRISTLSAGSRELLNRCPNPGSCTVEQHRKNRRAEFFLLSRSSKP